jgi:hypothetical protein
MISPLVAHTKFTFAVLTFLLLQTEPIFPTLMAMSDSHSVALRLQTDRSRTEFIPTLKGS